jgi:hypothetical protein
MGKEKRPTKEELFYEEFKGFVDSISVENYRVNLLNKALRRFLHASYLGNTNATEKYRVYSMASAFRSLITFKEQVEETIQKLEEHLLEQNEFKTIYLPDTKEKLVIAQSELLSGEMKDSIFLDKISTNKDWVESIKQFKELN